MDKITLLEGKRVVLGVTGSIAAYKAVDLASKLTQAGALVDVIMSDSAQRFVMPLSFQSVTGRPVYTDLWHPGNSDDTLTHIAHVSLGEGADLLLYAPLTAHSIAALAHGLADNLLTITALAARCPLLIAPAMDGAMFEHAATQANLETLVSRGVQVIDPAEGRFASGLVGKGRLPEPAELIGHVRRVLAQNGPLAGCRVVVTAGGTQEAIDPVRYLSNRSSGKQGYALAQAAVDAGAEVWLISTVNGLPVPVGATHVPVRSAVEMQNAVLAALDTTDALGGQRLSPGDGGSAENQKSGTRGYFDIRTGT
jgi:phosphopantothenoylcysteine decarboxylase/phosphopantothenate--cysteine ligase